MEASITFKGVGKTISNEILLAKNCDLKSVSLGKRIFRTETAAIVSVANVINQLT